MDIARFGDIRRVVHRLKRNVERRCRYRLGLHGFKLRAVPGEWDWYYLYETGGNSSIPDESKWYTLNQVINYCDYLREKDNDYRAERRWRMAR